MLARLPFPASARAARAARGYCGTSPVASRQPQPGDKGKTHTDSGGQSDGIWSEYQSIVFLIQVIVGMSGGVDSSVCALLLHQRGFKVEGVYMQNWDMADERGVCTSDQDYRDVADVCNKIGIPHRKVNRELTCGEIWMAFQNY